MDETKQFRRELQKFSEHIKLDMQNLLKGGGTRSDRHAKLQSLVGRKFKEHIGSRIPASDLLHMSEEEARVYVPSEWRLYKDMVSYQWVIRLGKETSRSRAMHKHGTTSSLKQCLQFAWYFTMQAQGMTALETPVQGLFPTRTYVEADDVLVLQQIEEDVMA